MATVIKNIGAIVKKQVRIIEALNTLRAIFAMAAKMTLFLGEKTTMGEKVSRSGFTDNLSKAKSELMSMEIKEISAILRRYVVIVGITENPLMMLILNIKLAIVSNMSTKSEQSISKTKTSI